MRRFTFMLFVAAAFAAGAAPDPVVEGFPAWEGLQDKNHVWGRVLTPSDLRHKVTIVLEIEPTDEKTAREMLLHAAEISKLDSISALGHSIAWERLELPRGVTFVVSDLGGKGSGDLVIGAIRTKSDDFQKEIAQLRMASIAVYKGVTFPGAPQAPEGKRPFVYAMGPSGMEPIFTGGVDRKSLADLKTAVGKAKKALPEWRPFYGPVAEPAHFKSLAQVFDPKKPKKLDEEFAKIRKGLVSKDPEVAKEAQVLYDAIEQTKSELVFRISLEAEACPHRAVYDMAVLTKYFPREKRNVARYSAILKKYPESAALGKMFSSVLEWSDPAFECKNEAEAKKIVAKLAQMKKSAEKMKNSPNVKVQNGAMVLEYEIDQLIDVIPSKVMSK